MAKYFYNKYNSVQGNWIDSSPWSSTGSGTGFIGGYTSYVFDAVNNTYSDGPTYGPIADYGVVYDLYTTYVVRHTMTSNNGTFLNFDNHQKNNSSNTRSYSQGTLVQANIVAEDGTYPANGRHTDGFWYVRGTLAFPALSVNIGGVQKAGVSGAVKIDEVWKPFNDMWVNVGGIWKKS